MTTTERRLKLIEVLALRRYDTMGNLAFEFGVSTRTIQRDLLEINDTIPIECKPGRYDGGIYVMEGFSAQRSYMNDQEIQLLKKLREFAVEYQNKLFSQDEILLLSKILYKYSKPKSK